MPTSAWWPRTIRTSSATAALHGRCPQAGLMVTRRKYRARPDPPDQTNVGVVPAQGPPVAPGPATDADGASPFQRAHEALQHAEALQQQHRHRQQIGLAEPARSEAELRAIDQFVESIPNISDHQRRFLRSHPTLMTSPYDELMGHAILVARHAGIKPDTDAMDRAILVGVQRDLEHHRALSARRPRRPADAAERRDARGHRSACRQSERRGRAAHGRASARADRATAITEKEHADERACVPRFCLGQRSTGPGQPPHRRRGADRAQLVRRSEHVELRKGAALP